MISRRSFLSGLVAAPVVVKATSLMQIRGIVLPPFQHKFIEFLSNEIVTRAEWFDDGQPTSPLRGFTITRIPLSELSDWLGTYPGICPWPYRGCATIVEGRGER